MDNVTWGELDEIQQYILTGAATEAERVSAFDPITTAAIRGLHIADLLRMVSSTEYTITPKGRRVYEAREAADATDSAAFDPYDYSVMTATELLDIVRTIWNEYDLGASTEMVVSLADEHRLKLALSATPATDELATLRQQLAAAQADNARLVARAKVADDHADTYDAAYGLLREDARLLRRALAKHAPDVLKELPLNDRGQEWDKVNSIVDGLRHRIVYLRASLKDIRDKAWDSRYSVQVEATMAIERDDKQHTAKYERAADAGSE